MSESDGKLRCDDGFPELYRASFLEVLNLAVLSSCQNVMFLGDFNAACGYVAKKNRKNIRLLSDPSFIWLIQDHVDTTVKQSTDCAYDRYASKMFILA